MSRTNEGLSLPEKEENIISELDIEHVLCFETDILSAYENNYENLQSNGKCDNRNIAHDIITCRKALKEMQAKLSDSQYRLKMMGGKQTP